MSAGEVFGCVSLAVGITLIVGYWIGYLDGRDSSRRGPLQSARGIGTSGVRDER